MRPPPLLLPLPLDVAVVTDDAQGGSRVSHSATGPLRKEEPPVEKPPFPSESRHSLDGRRGAPPRPPPWGAIWK